MTVHHSGIYIESHNLIYDTQMVYSVIQVCVLIVGAMQFRFANFFTLQVKVCFEE